MRFFLVTCVVVLGPSASAQQVDFNRDVRPILADKCFPCHGPDGAARQAELRLDLRQGLFANRDGRRPFVPGKPQVSEALRRIRSGDPDERMPPVDSNKSLTAQQIATLTRWVKQGAKWTRHWSFIAPQRPQLPHPTKQDRRWIRNPIDNFIAARLRRQAMRPLPAADSLTLVRRAYQDLIGIIPTPAEADRWTQTMARSDTGYEQMVDHLLSSPAYGERWGRRWLDLARYADTNGYEKDRARSIWPYRDWTISAMNRDLPFNQFSIEQLAGDMLKNPSIQQRVATGFHRNTMLNEEGGIDPLEYRFYAMTDRVATTGLTWLGLTLGCAQCHSHKFDPVSQREYYQFMAFLNNADEPDLQLVTADQQRRQRGRLRQAQRLLKQLPKAWPRKAGDLQQRFTQWLTRQRARFVHWRNLTPAKATANLPLLTIQRDQSIYATGDSTKQDKFQIEFQATDTPLRAVRIEAIPDPRLPAGGPGMTYYEGTKGDFFLTELQMFANGKRVKLAHASHSYAKNRFGGLSSAATAIDGDVQTGWSVHGRIGERHTAVFQLDKPLPAGAKITLHMMFGRHFSSSLGRFRVAGTSAANAQAIDSTARFEQLIATKNPTATQRQELLEAFLLSAPEVKGPARRIKRLLQRPKRLTSLVMQERPRNNPRPTHIHKRGEYLRTQAKVTPATPSVLHKLANGQKPDRLGLARWLVDRQNPLTARVVVNRHWAALFGRGIVQTIGDFGLQGKPPTHPKLLDWLAVEFMEQGWSLKKLHRLIVTSATYRQAANSDRSIWLRGVPRKRLEAEVIRDSILKSAGVLTNQLGGPPVYPPQPAGAGGLAWGGTKWPASRGSQRYRRSVYIFMKRTAPFAMLRTFDAPSGESCTANRNRSNTALQALTILNDVMFVEAAQRFAERLTITRANDRQQIERAFRLVLTRRPEPNESAALLRFVAKLRQRLQRGALSATSIAGKDKGQTVNEVAVWTAVARVLFSLDENQTRN